MDLALERTYSAILLFIALVGSIGAYVVFATPFALRIEGANFGSTTVYVHVTFTNYAVVQGATVYFIGTSSTGQTLTTTRLTDSHGDASAGIYGIMFDSTVSGKVRVVYAPSSYDQTKNVYGQSGSTTTLMVNDVPIPVTPTTTTTTVTTKTYELAVVVKDQVGNLLEQATVEFVGKSTKTTDNLGMAKETFNSGESVTVQASFTKQGRTFQSSKTVTVDSAKTENVVINRQFYWTFELAYTNDTKPNGVLTLQSATKNVTAGVSDGIADAWLDNEVYTVYFRASPESKIGTVAPVNDGSQSYSLTPPTDTGGAAPTSSSTVQSSTSASEPAGVTSPLGEVKLSFSMLYVLIGIVVTVIGGLGVYAVYSFVRGDDS